MLPGGDSESLRVSLQRVVNTDPHRPQEKPVNAPPDKRLTGRIRPERKAIDGGASVPHLSRTTCVNK